MCDENNLKDQSFTNIKLKGLICNQNNLKDQFVTNLKFKGPLIIYSEKKLQRAQLNFLDFCVVIYIY